MITESSIFISISVFNIIAYQVSSSVYVIIIAVLLGELKYAIWKVFPNSV